MPNIVVIGGGSAGLGTAQALAKSGAGLPSGWKIIVVDQRDYYWHLPAGLRAPLEKKVRESATIPFDRVFQKGSPASIIKAKATKIDSTYVYTDAAGEAAKIEYTYLVYAAGRTWSTELNLPDARNEALTKLAQQGEQIDQAKQIVVVGGGAAGIELAAEIATKYGSEKSVTLVHRGKGLLNDVYPEKLRNGLLSQLKKQGVTVKLGSSIAPGSSAGTVALSDGTSITCDLIFETIGGSPNSDLLMQFNPALVAANGYVPVNATFQTKANEKIFALGDIADLKEQKQSAKIPKHIPVVAANIVSLVRGEKPAKLYKGQSEIIIVTIGKTGGAGWLMGMNVGSWISKTIKSKGLFISQVRSQLNYK